MSKIKRALISVWDKKGIVELAKFLSQNKDAFDELAEKIIL